MEQALIKKMIRQNLTQYHFVLEDNEAKSVYTLLIERIQKRQDANDGELYEIIEDEVYTFITNT